MKSSLSLAECGLQQISTVIGRARQTALGGLVEHIDIKPGADTDLGKLLEQKPIRTMKFHFDGWLRTLKFYLLYHKFCVGE
jgi:hypothetical protein